jgi:hypothetical protein
MFDDVFDDKQWKAARDKTGLKVGLTGKVSMSDEFKRFHQNKTVDGAKVLLGKIVLYEKDLKEKHSKEKYYNNLLQLVHRQKAAIEAGIQEAENPNPNQQGNRPVIGAHREGQGLGQRPVDKEGKVMSDKDMDDLVGDIVGREKEHARQYENTNNDPNAPAFPGEGRRVYLKLTKEFKTVEENMKSEHAAVTQLLQKCKAFETTPNLQAKPEAAIGVAEKIVETLNKIETKSSDLHMDFSIEAQVVGKEEGKDHPATKALDKMTTSLSQEMEQIAVTSRACRVAVKNALQSLGNNPKAQEVMRLLHV